MADLKNATTNERQLADEIKLKLSEPTPAELRQIGVVFDRMLSQRGKSRRDWLQDQNRKFDETALSHLLAGRRKSRELGKAVCDYIVEAAEK